MFKEPIILDLKIEYHIRTEFVFYYFYCQFYIQKPHFLLSFGIGRDSVLNRVESAGNKKFVL